MGARGLAGALANRWGKLDILVLNAATLGTLTPVPHIALKEWEQVVALNLTANFRMIRAFDTLLRASDADRLVAVTSSLAVTPRAYWGSYAATKAALESLVATYAAEIMNITKVRAVSFDPRATATTMRARAFPGEDATTLKTPADVAAVLVKLLQDDFETGGRVAY